MRARLLWRSAALLRVPCARMSVGELPWKEQGPVRTGQKRGPKKNKDKLPNKGDPACDGPACGRRLAKLVGLRTTLRQRERRPADVGAVGCEVGFACDAVVFLFSCWGFFRSLSRPFPLCFWILLVLCLASFPSPFSSFVGQNGRRRGHIACLLCNLWSADRLPCCSILPDHVSAHFCPPGVRLSRSAKVAIYRCRQPAHYTRLPISQAGPGDDQCGCDGAT